MPRHAVVPGHYYGKLAMLYTPSRGSLHSVGSGSGKVLKTVSSNVGITNSFSIAFWVKKDLTASNGVIIDITSSYSANANQIIVTMPPTNLMRVRLHGPGAAGPGLPFKGYDFAATTDTNWHHWAITWDGTNLRGYKDGVEDTAPIKEYDGSDTMTNTLRVIYVGAWSLFSLAPWDGPMGNIGIWSAVLSDATILELSRAGYISNLYSKSSNYNIAGNLLHWYRFLNAESLAEAGKDRAIYSGVALDLSFVGLGLTHITNEQPTVIEIA